MLDHTLDELLLAHLKTIPALAAVHGYTGQDNADHKLPALTVSTTSEPLAGSDTAFRGEVGIIVESEENKSCPCLGYYFFHISNTIINYYGYTHR